MIYNGHFEPNFLYSRMYKSAAVADQEEYRKHYRFLEEHPGDITAISELVRLLHHYVFDRSGIHIKNTVDEPRLPLWFSEKPEAAKELFRLIEQLPEEFCVKPYFHHVYLALQAQHYFISGDWSGTLGCYVRWLAYTADIEKWEKSAHISHFDAIELRCKIISNACLIQKLNGAPEQADFLRRQLHADYDALRREYDERSKSTSWASVYDERWKNITSNDCFYYHTMPGGRPYFRELSPSEESDPNTAFYWIHGSSSDYFKPAYAEELSTGEVMLMAHQPPDEKHLPPEHYRIAKIAPDYLDIIPEALPEFPPATQPEAEPEPVLEPAEPQNMIELGELNSPGLNAALQELNSLTGLAGVKEAVSSLINLLKLRKVRTGMGLPQLPSSLHLVFTGAPGTGKTTVARLIARIYHELGVVSQGQFVEVKRPDLVGGYVGHTALKTQEVIDKALGGVLFIDEAYTLASGDSQDFGYEAINTLLTALEGYRDDFTVIVAGYPEQMENFIQSNPGLRSRFSKYIRFEDYAPGESLSIFQSMCSKAGLTPDRDAERAALRHFTSRYNKRDANFANARDVRNFFEMAVENQANRLAAMLSIPENEITTLRVEDIDAAANRQGT